MCWTLIFDDRNKSYGAYDLRKTYNKRITKALVDYGISRGACIWWSLPG